MYNKNKEMLWSKVLYEGALYRLIIKVPRKGSKRATYLVRRINNFLILLKSWLLWNLPFDQPFACFYLISSQDDNVEYRMWNLFDIYS